jgi:outer membrane protein assembly factor BamB
MKNINKKIPSIMAAFFIILLLLSCCKQGTESEENPYAPLKLKYERNIGEFFCPPLLENDVLYVITNDDQAYALNPENGKSFWQTTVNGHPDVLARIIHEGDYLYYPVVWGSAACMNKETGQIVWQISPRPNSNYAKIEIDGDRLYVAGIGDVGLVAINKNDGSILWERSPLGLTHTTPIIMDSLLYIATNFFPGNTNEYIGKLYCYDKFTGEEVYNTEYGILGQGGPANDVVAKDSLIFLPSGSKVFAINRFTTDIDWEIEIPADPVMGGDATVGVMVLDGDRIFSATVWGGAYCIDISSKSLLWFSRPVKSTVGSSPPLVTEDKIFWRYAGGEIVALDKHTGKHYWTALSQLVAPLITPGYIYGFVGGVGLRVYSFPL